ncbi:nitrogen fixation protein NifX [Candidatus Mycolicibacterium alkanivorans]|uniref:Nitrogen fixation protein NifX n=1 Tax=Candidatus Mycolicibacterium alkanivorans TaxID=2954114 RepID=A0ABS9YQV5_9MYCO|nr:nitrogen fixation protein NifX [Candidatus Mycolicibacterium alkanivorans]MCI4673636.1 nitrogen fixation protein NifX [Candidatus Mycolicibacterium alkanivorans]
MLKIAFATSDGHAVDQHFGWCQRFDVYEVSADDARLFETRELDAAPDDEQSKIASRLACVADCAILNVCDIGGSAAAKVVNARIHPVKVPPGTAVDEMITRLQAVLSGNPPPWLRKILRQHSTDPVPAWTPTGAS